MALLLVVDDGRGVEAGRVTALPPHDLEAEEATLGAAMLSADALAIVLGYSYTKRFTSAAHFILGGAIAFAPTAAWIAIDPTTVGWPAICLTGAVLFWIAGFDIIYACQDSEVDRREATASASSKTTPAPATTR